ncbi:MAG: 5-formyltetrahydrofolate cyclo-ligase [Myxococcaceae bacterium]|nr:5-formyltetrahydrofolate cyclo-ligase [Myxococcaceae bacterium]
MAGNAFQGKQAARRVAEAYRRSLEPLMAVELGGGVRRHLAALSVFARARSVALYAAQPFEPDLDPLLSELVGRGVQVSYPRVDGRSLRFVPVTSLAELTPGAYGVRAPPDAPGCTPEVICVPGVAFSRSGQRLGRGGGYYDRALAHGSGVPLGIGWAACVVDTLPVEPHDVPMHQVVTDAFVLGPWR